MEIIGESGSEKQNIISSLVRDHKASNMSTLLNKISAAEVLSAQHNRPKWRPGRACEACKIEFIPTGPATHSILFPHHPADPTQPPVFTGASSQLKSKFEPSVVAPTPAPHAPVADGGSDQVKKLASLFGGSAAPSAVPHHRRKESVEAKKIPKPSGSDRQKRESKEMFDSNGALIPRKRKVKKHHCRNCGGVFCSRCAKHTIALPSMGYLENVRVCNTCFPVADAALQQWLALNESRNAKVVSGISIQTAESRLHAEQELRRAARRQKKKDMQYIKDLTLEHIPVNQEKNIFNAIDSTKSKSFAQVMNVTRDQDLKLMSKHGATEVYALSAIDPLFTKIPKNMPGLRIWRIEFMEIEEWPRSRFGEFHVNDSYVILHSFIPDDEKDQPNRATELSIAVEHHIYFWLGSECCHDERAVAAIKSTELARHLEGLARIHREVQAEESDQFKAIFPVPLAYLPGGIETGLNEIPAIPQLPPRLFMIKGTSERVRIHQVPCDWKSLNTGDVFVLERNDKIIYWCGKLSNRFERAKSLQFSLLLREKRNSLICIEALREGLDDLYQQNQEFWNTLGAHENVSHHIRSAEDGDPDDRVEHTILDLFEVFETGDESNPFHFGLVEKKSADLSRSLLNSEKIYILDCETEIFIWIGKKSTRVTKLVGMQLLLQFLQYYDRPDWIPVTRMMESAEVPSFKCKFKDWDHQELKEKLREDFQSLVPEVSPPIIEMTPEMLTQFVQWALKNPVKEDETIPKKPYNYTPSPQDGSMVIYEIRKTDLLDVPAKMSGFFASNSAYVVVFTFQMYQIEKFDIPRDESSVRPSDEAAVALKQQEKRKKLSVQHWVFFWQGRECPKISVITWKMELENEICGMLENSTGVRPFTFEILQGKEPSFFLDLFGGHITVCAKRLPSSLSGDISDAEEEEKPDESYHKKLYHIKDHVYQGKSSQMVLEVEPSALSINPGDSFVLTTEDDIIVWLGAWCNDIERASALELAQKIKTETQNVEVIDRRKERAVSPLETKFWSHLSGELAELSGFEENQVLYTALPKLFQCSVAEGFFKVSPIDRFHQEDLNSDDVMMLDVVETVYLWIGKFSRKDELMNSRAFANEYVSNAQDRNPGQVMIKEIHEDNEPWEFTQHFHGWQRSRKLFVDPYQKNIEVLESLGVMGRVL
jgi:hypothetical protein